ncbi:unnamed protein product, partial [Urochloa humidicola]
IPLPLRIARALLVFSFLTTPPPSSRPPLAQPPPPPPPQAQGGSRSSAPPGGGSEARGRGARDGHASNASRSTPSHRRRFRTSKITELPEQPPSQFGNQKQVQVPDDQGMNCAAISEGEWADTLTDISVGYLLTEASKGTYLDCMGTSSVKNALLLENPCSYDSFDAAVALHVSRFQASEQPGHLGSRRNM